MNISQAKLINLVDFLEQEGHKAVKQKGHIYWYNSPIRSESTPSFKVDSSRNEWYDYGLGEGGDILDLIKGLYNVKTTSEALSILAPKSNSFINAIYHRKDAPPKRQESGQMHNVVYHPLTHQALLSYMMKRKIDVNLSRCIVAKSIMTCATSIISALLFVIELEGTKSETNIIKDV